MAIAVHKAKNMGSELPHQYGAPEFGTIPKQPLPEIARGTATARNMYDPYGERFELYRIPGRSYVRDPDLDHGPIEQNLAHSHSLPPHLRGSEVRRVRTRSRRSYTGDVPMTRIGRKLVSGESMLELDFLLVADDVMSDLLDVVAQPFELSLQIAVKRHGWVPDFLISRRASLPTVVEVKTEEELHPKNPEKFRAIRARTVAMRTAAQNAGYAFGLVTEREVRVQPRLSNASLVHRSMSPFYTAAEDLAADIALAKLDSDTSVPALARVLPPGLRPFALPLALRLERRSMLRFDRRLAITRLSPFARSGTGK